MVAFGGGWAWVARSLNALRRNTAEPYEVILVDNGGATDRMVPDDAEIIRNDTNIGFGPGSNQGAEYARAELLCFLNTDTLVEPGWLPPLLERIADEPVGAMFPTKLNVDGSLQEAGAFVTRDAYAYVFGEGEDAEDPQHNFAHDIDFGSAACMCITRRRYETIGGFDPAYRVAYYEDADLCFRLREAGLRVVYEPRSRVTHVRTVSVDVSSLADVSAANREVFLSRWGRTLERRSGLAELQQDVRLRLAARDFHTQNRVLLLEAKGFLAEELAHTTSSTNPGTRLTLLTQRIDASFRRRLLAAGVEVVSGVRVEEWLTERAGHYTHVVAAQDSRSRRLRPVLQTTQPQASFVDSTRLDSAARREPLTRIFLGISR
jgi:GT2 family glycosyltransferase